MSWIENLFAKIDWNSQIAGNSVLDYFISGCVFLGLILLIGFFQKYVLWRLAKAAEKTNSDIDDTLVKVIGSVGPSFYVFFALLISIIQLSFDTAVNRAIEIGILILIVFQAIKVMRIVVDYTIARFARRENDEGAISALKTIGSVLKAILWVVGVLLVLQNLGVNVTSLIAGLGIGGVAIALAAQNILSDLFSSFAIIFDKPFVPGDFIVVGEYAGVVEKIGIKTTRIRALQGEEIVISNQELTSTRIQNFKRLKERRVVIKTGVIYSTDQDKIEKIPALIKHVVEMRDNARFDRSHLLSLGESALIYETVFFVTSPDYTEYMDIQQDILLQIMKTFRKEKIEFAFPTQTVHVKK